MYRSHIVFSDEFCRSRLYTWLASGGGGGATCAKPMPAPAIPPGAAVGASVPPARLNTSLNSKIHREKTFTFGIAS